MIRPQRISKQKTRQQGFTTIELALVFIVICVLATLVFTTRSGVQQNERNAERQHDVKELRDGLESYFAQHNRYPTLDDINSSSWRQANLKSLDTSAYQDPLSQISELTASPAKNIYAYAVTSASGTGCDDDKTPCTQYTLTATLEGGGTYTKSNLN